MATIKLDLDSFNEILNKSTKPVLVDFYADWCGPCKIMAPVIEEISNENSEIAVCKLNVDENPDLATQFGIMSIPTLVAFKNGKEYKRNVGAIPKQNILELVQ
ncbi:MAG: thioredoxin [Clostridiales bacterium]|jgi:thioredoxin 1|nr:thioredoxin [Clostridiales bacterium]